MAQKAHEPIAAATFGEVEGHRPLSVGPGRGGGATGVRGLTMSASGSGFEKLRTNLARVEGTRGSQCRRRCSGSP